MSARVRLSLPALLAILLAAVVSQTPAAAAAAGRPLHPARSATAASRGFGSFIAVSRDGMSATLPGFGSALVGSAPVKPGPSAVAADPVTHTIYVASGFNSNGLTFGGDTVSVIDARRCNARDVSRCQGPWPTITVGTRTPSDLPSGIAVDVNTDTVYVANVGANTVSVFNGATCNAIDTAGCGQTPAEVPVGLQPITLAADPANHTVYVANFGAPGLGGPPGNSTTVSMINSATCNATDLATCPAKPPPTVNVGAAPNDVTLDQATHTVYVTTIGAHTAQNGWAVFDASTCNATVHTGCATIGKLIGDPVGPNGAEIDPANDTLYTANWDTTVSAFSLRHCDAADLAGCATDKPGIVAPVPPNGIEHDLYVAVDARLHSVYVTYQKDDALFVIDTRVCNGQHLAGCATLRPPALHTGTDPEGIVLDTRTQTLYTADEVANAVSVIDPARCNATVTSGCRHPAPAVATPGPGASAADPAVHTAYVTSDANAVAMIDTRACNAHHLAGCVHTPAQATVGTFPAGIAADPGTHTVYVANFGSGKTGTVSVLDAGTCNATHTAGCTKLPTLAVPGGHPDGLAVNTATGTLYVATITAHGPNLISVFNAATCNAATTAGCGQAPAVLTAGPSARGNSTLNLAVNQVTDTLYAANVVLGNPYTGHTVAVFNGATCNGTNQTGCSQTPATVHAGDNPFGVAVDQATDTIYTANNVNGEHQGTVSVINGKTCSGTNHTGCSQTPANVKAGFGAIAVAVDPATNIVYVTNLEDTSVSVINGNTCNGTNHTGCSHTPPKIAVGNYPDAITTDPAVRTAYVSNVDNTVSVIPLSHCQPAANGQPVSKRR